MAYWHYSRARWLPDGTWETPGAESVQEAAGTQSSMAYIGRKQVTTAQWVALRAIFKVFSGENGYKGVGCRRDAWWRKEAAERQLWETLVEAWEARISI